MKSKIAELVALQNKLNDNINDTWRELNLDWGTAIISEIGELLNHWTAWKWWKNSDITPAKMAQIKLELVDIFHFILSDLIANFGDVLAVDCINAAFKQQVVEYDPVQIVKEAKLLCIDAANDKNCPIQFAALVSAFGVGFDELHKLFIAKNALNEFRQTNFYKAGGYIKEWSGKEDNEHLAEIVEKLQDFTRENVIAELHKSYFGA